MHKVAKLASRVFFPLQLAALLLLIVGWVGGDLLLALVVILVAVGVPAIAIGVSLRLGLVADWSLSDRRQRWPFVLISLGALVLSGVIVSWAGFPQPFSVVLACIAVAVFVAGLVNLWWKVSAHSTMAGLFASAMLFVSPIIIPFAIVVAVVVGWSRVTLRAHSVLQVIIGLALGGTIGLLAQLFV